MAAIRNWTVTRFSHHKIAVDNRFGGENIKNMSGNEERLFMTWLLIWLNVLL